MVHNQDACERSRKADSLKIAQFYLSDRQIVNALLEASDNGAGVKIILGPNKDAFGYVKNGIPNRQVAGELRRRSAGRVEVRWYDTHGEQFHTKLFNFTSDFGQYRGDEKIKQTMYLIQEVFGLGTF